MQIAAYLMAQGKGSRWKDRPAPWNQNFADNAPLYKHLLEVASEPILRRSLRLFEAAGFETTVISDPELLAMAEIGRQGFTLEYPGDDIIEGVLATISLREDAPDVTLVALGDVLFSGAAVRSLARAVHVWDMGAFARVEPSPVCPKVADEVFAMWFSRARRAVVCDRLQAMLLRDGTSRPMKPWAFPLAVSRDPGAIQTRPRSGLGLKSIRNELLVSEDYTDDVDSPTEWSEFWPGIRAAAMADTPALPEFEA